MEQKQVANRQSLDFPFLGEREDKQMIDDSGETSPNIVGLLAGLITIPVLLGMIAGVIWMLWTLVTLFSPWTEMM